MNCGGRILTQPKVSCQRQRDGCCEKCLSTSQSDMRHMTRWRRGFTCCCVWMPCHASPTAVPLQPTASCILSHDAHMTPFPYHMTLDHPPSPSYHVNRDTLFCYHAASEEFLQRLMSLYVASHYKNSPNDLQLLSDAPAHRIFALLGPLDPSSSSLPEILCVLQVRTCS